jgi:hypothetical protein
MNVVPIMGQVPTTRHGDTKKIKGFLYDFLRASVSPW